MLTQVFLIAWSRFSLTPWQNASRDEVTVVLKALCGVAKRTRREFHFSIYLRRAISYDGRSYERHSLPGRVAGYATVYHHGGTPFWEAMVNQSHERLIDPRQSSALRTRQEDDTGYLAITDSLQPGAWLGSGETLEEGGLSRRVSFDNCWSLMRGPSGELRMTTSDHGFRNSDEVFHPKSQGTRVGE